jgi:hypothetical protein
MDSVARHVVLLDMRTFVGYHIRWPYYLVISDSPHSSTVLLSITVGKPSLVVISASYVGHGTHAPVLDDLVIVRHTRWHISALNFGALLASVAIYSSSLDVARIGVVVGTSTGMQRTHAPIA